MSDFDNLEGDHLEESDHEEPMLEAQYAMPHEEAFEEAVPMSEPHPFF